jgi:holo-[acyl-carrier protein] synthase
LAVLCGVDIVETERMKQSLEKEGHAFRDRVFSDNEIKYCEGRNAVKYQSYAARFAAKEAVSKAFGTGIGEKINWKDIEVQNDKAGKPYIVLSARATEIFNKFNGINISLSLSHCDNYAVAYAVLEIR